MSITGGLTAAASYVGNILSPGQGELPPITPSTQFVSAEESVTYPHFFYPLDPNTFPDVSQVASQNLSNLPTTSNSATPPSLAEYTIIAPPPEGPLSTQASTVQTVASNALGAPIQSVEAQFTPLNLAKVKGVSVPFKNTQIHFKATYNGLAANIKEKTLNELAQESKEILTSTAKLYESQLENAQTNKLTKKEIQELQKKVEILKTMTSFSMRVVKNKLCVDIYSEKGKFTHTFDSDTRITGTPNFTIENHILKLRENLHHALRTDPKFADQSGFTFLRGFRQNGGIIPKTPHLPKEFPHMEKIKPFMPETDPLARFKASIANQPLIHQMGAGKGLPPLESVAS